MKINIKKIFGIIGLATLLYSCDTNNEVTGYDADNYNYTSPTTFTIVENSSTDNNFVVTYTPSSEGKGYYAVVPAGTAAPTSTQVHSGSGFQQTGSFDVDNSTPVDITINSNIYGAYTYDVYAIHKSTDNFISETVTKISVTTPDTMDPEFIREDSSPAFTAAGISPFAPVTLQFSEPVFYQGGDINFTAFDGGSGAGRQVTVNSASVMSMSGTSITINTHGTFQQDDFNIVTWGADTFKDISGKSVAPLTGFGHYFSTREFTLPETAFLMQGTWNYSTVFYGGLGGFYAGNASLFLPDTGQIELKLDPSDPEGLTLLGINIFSPLNQLGFPDEPDNMKIRIGEAGELQVLEENQNSGVPSGGGTPFEWAPWSFFGTSFPGFYDFEGGTINHWLQLIVSDSGAVIDAIDYDYTRVGTFAKSTPSVVKNLEKKNELIQKKIEQNKTYKKVSFATIK